MGDLSPTGIAGISELSPLAADGLPMPNTPVILDPPSTASPLEPTSQPVGILPAKPPGETPAVSLPVYPYALFKPVFAAQDSLSSASTPRFSVPALGSATENLQQTILLAAPNYTRSVIDDELQWRFHSLQPQARTASSIVNHSTTHGHDRESQPYELVNETIGVGLPLQTGTWLFLKPSVASTAVGSNAANPSFGLDAALPLAGDFNGDGISELVLFRDGEWFIDTNNNGVWDDGDTWAKFGAQGDRPIVADSDGDGRAEVGVVVQPRRSQHATTTGTVEQSSSAENVWQPVAGEFNGDGHATRGLFRDGTWRFEQPLPGSGEKLAKVLSFGQANDRPVVGDFDGDGVDEIGVFRDGRWIIDSNHNGAIDAADKVFELGAAGDYPVVGDFNGDGVDEPAVYRAQAVGPAARITRKP